jgi:hypothetical protein
VFGNIKDKITQYLQLRYEIIRLELIERLVNVMGYVIFIVMVLFFAFSFILFTGFGIAEWLSDIMNSRYGGYFATGGVMLIFTILVSWRSASIVKFFANKFIRLLTAVKDNDDKKDGPTS